MNNRVIGVQTFANQTTDRIHCDDMAAAGSLSCARLGLGCHVDRCGAACAELDYCALEAGRVGTAVEAEMIQWLSLIITGQFIVLLLVVCAIGKHLESRLDQIAEKLEDL